MSTSNSRNINIIYCVEFPQIYKVGKTKEETADIRVHLKTSLISFNTTLQPVGPSRLGNSKIKETK